MQNTVPAGEGAMCAVISMDAEKIEEVIEPIADVSVANYNCPGQIVITGKTKAVEEAAGKLKEAGARRTIMLNVSGPFHSKMLVPAGEKLAEELENTRFHKLKIPYVTNECNSREGNRHQRNSGTSYDTDQFTGALDAEHGAHDRRWCGYIRRNRTGQDTGRILKKNQSKCESIPHFPVGGCG